MAVKNLASFALSAEYREMGGHSTDVKTPPLYKQFGSGTLTNTGTIVMLPVPFQHVDFMNIVPTSAQGSTALASTKTFDFTVPYSYGTCQAGGSAGSPVLVSGKIDNDNEFIGFKIKFIDGDGNTYIRKITDSTSSSDTVTLDEALPSAPDTDWKAAIYAVMLTHTNPGGAAGTVKWEAIGRYE